MKVFKHRNNKHLTSENFCLFSRYLQCFDTDATMGHVSDVGCRIYGDIMNILFSLFQINNDMISNGYTKYSNSQLV